MASAMPTLPSPEPPEYTFTVEQYHRMIDAGIITEEDRVEFIEGVLVPKMTRNPPHDSTLDILQDTLRAILPKRWRLRGQMAIALADGEPEPDVAIVIGPARRYDNHHPTPEEIALVMEVSETSLRTDYGKKYRSYAGAGIPEYWIINLVSDRIEVYTKPEKPRRGRPRYANHVSHSRGQEIPVIIGKTQVGTITVDAILPQE